MLEVIVNPASGAGRARQAAARVGAELTRLRIEHSIREVASFSQAAQCAHAAHAGGHTAVALGGDGLISAVARASLGTDGVLGVLPSGRGNDLARALGIPLDPVKACEVLATGAPARLDAGRAGGATGATFLGIACCGIDSAANRIANDARILRGSAVYAYGALRALAAWKPARFSVRVDGEPLRFTGYTVAVANAAFYGGGMRMAPGASLTDGLFDVVLLADIPRARFVTELPKVFSGAHATRPFVRILRAREVSIDADRPFTVYADGDPLAELPVTLTAAPGAVRVQVPARSPLLAPRATPAAA